MSQQTKQRNALPHVCFLNAVECQQLRKVGYLSKPLSATILHSRKMIVSHPTTATNEFNSFGSEAKCLRGNLSQQFAFIKSDTSRNIHFQNTTLIPQRRPCDHASAMVCLHQTNAQVGKAHGVHGPQPPHPQEVAMPMQMTQAVC